MQELGKYKAYISETVFSSIFLAFVLVNEDENEDGDGGEDEDQMKSIVKRKHMKSSRIFVLI
ncbi:hypothetical protein SOVF_024340 isoform B [Spinacia oleracea]|nr:hypothetical protein SOVF_024340 isoform B [Spinacia oleracea]